MTSTSARAIILAATTLLILTLTGQPGLASPYDTTAQQAVTAYLAAHPGGTQITTTDISYSNGTFVVTVVPPAHHLDGPDCPSSWFCFYAGINYSYPRGKLSSCGWQDLAWWGWQNNVESAQYNLGTGSVWFINHAGADHANDTVLFDIGTNLTTRPDVNPYRNQADHVYRIC